MEAQARALAAEIASRIPAEVMRMVDRLTMMHRLIAVKPHLDSFVRQCERA